VIAFAGCGAHSKEEEIFDTLLLIARNVLQFGRLAAVMRQYVAKLFPFFSGLWTLLQIWPIDILSTETHRLDDRTAGGVY
jgi:hypothetical protein